MSSAVNDARTDVAIMVDPLSALAEITRFGRGLSGALSRETVAACTRDCIERVFSPAAFALALQEPKDRLGLLASFGNPTPRADDPFIAEVLAKDGVVRHRSPARMGAQLVGAGRTMGVLAVWGNGPDAFDEQDEAVLAALGVQAAIALQNSSLISILSSGKREWEQLVDAIRPAIAVVGAAGAIRRANRAFADLVGSPVTALTGRPWMLLLPPAWADPVGRALSAPDGDGGEIRTDQRTFTVRAHPLADEPGVSVLLIENVTETRRLQEQLVQSEKLSAIGQLIAGVAHELNNPLASVLGFADFLAEAGRMPPEFAEPVRVIQQESQRAAGIVRNLLTFARRQEQEHRHVDVGAILQRTIQLLGNQLISLKVEQRLEVEAGLPAVACSPNQLQQVFLNLINNSAQAIASAGRGGTVTISARAWLDGVAVEVRDDGPGIPDDLQQRVFEPFFTTKPAGQGTGLGLSICQGIIKEHGGRITLKSARGEGATFTVELPAARAGQPAAPAEPRAARAGPSRILVVDDEPHILHYMRATLEAWGHTVETAADGVEALTIALGGAHDVIITDVRMPKLGGREFYERLSAERPEIAARVVFSTGDSVRDDTMAFLERSGRPFLHKPFKLAELRSTLSAALESDR
jgi:two-component system NtrC family sensor kinase